MAHQQHGRGLGQAVGPEIRAGVHRLLGEIEQEHAAGALLQHDAHRLLGHGLVGEEIELEALPQQLVGDVADAALPGGAGIRHDDVDAAEALASLGKGVGDFVRLGHVALQPKSLEALRRLPGRVAIDIEDGDGGAFGGERLCRGAADGAGAGDQRHLPGQRLDHRALQLRLLKAPIFEREQIALGERLVAADAFGVGDHAHGVLGEIGGHVGVLRGAPDAEQSEPRHEHHAGR